jgi:hypothetical protein
MRPRVHNLTLPLPWGSISLFDIMEPVRSVDQGTIVCHRLYLADPYIKGGRRLIRQGPETLWPNGLNLNKSDEARK